MKNLLKWFYFTALLLVFLTIVCLPLALADTLPAGNLRISSESRDIILYYEVGGESYYRQCLERPEVPPGASGITVGIGYDCGYNTPAQIRADWAGVIPDTAVERLAGIAGRKGAMARAVLSRVRDIRIPWQAAVKVYENKTVPRFAKLTEDAYPGILAMDPHIQGVMLSTSFNRGTAFAGERRRELRWTRDDIAASRVALLPGYQLQMRRLWPDIAGLRKRYSAHAGLMQRAIDTTGK